MAAKKPFKVAISLQLTFGVGISGPIKISDVAIFQNIPEQSALFIIFKEVVEEFFKLRVVVTNSPGEAAAFSKYNVITNVQISEHPGPLGWLVVIDNRPG